MTRKKSTPSARAVPRRTTSSRNGVRRTPGHTRANGDALLLLPPMKQWLPESDSPTLNELRQPIEETQLRALIDANMTAQPRGNIVRARNLRSMRTLLATWPEEPIVQRALHKLASGVSLERLDARGASA